MSFKVEQGPKPADLLYKNLFLGQTAEQSYQLLSEGLSGCCQNAERLLADAEHLAQADRLCSARFLLTTAREELAKPYILLDACRLDFEKHESVLRALCGAFYNHIAKHAYVELQRFPSLGSMAEVMDLWKVEVQRWWPTEPESGEPDMPHDTYFDRELPLYVDFSDYSRSWLIPDNDAQRAYFMPILAETEISRPRELVAALHQAESMGFFTPKCLQVINEVFKNRYVGNGTMAESIQHLYERVAQKIEKDFKITAQSFLRSTIVQWPLYHCASHGY